MEKIGIIGAGEIGLTLAEILALQGFKVVIQNRYHEVDGRPSPYWLGKMGKIMDMNDSLQLPHCSEVLLTSDMNEINGANIIVITSGAKRSNPDETREELAKKNLHIIENYVELIVKNPDSLFLIISNPVDSLTQFLIERSAKASSRNISDVARKIVGVSFIDSMRLINLVKEFVKSKYHDMIINEVTGVSIGEHGPTMVPIMSQVQINKNLLESFASANEVEHIAKQTVLRGNDIIKLTGTSSVLGPAHAVYYMIMKIARAQKGSEVIIPSSVWDGKRAIGCLAKFIDNSFTSIVDLEMNQQERDRFAYSCEVLDKQYKKIVG